MISMAHFQKTDTEWKKELTSEQFHTLREKGTERPFSGEYVDKNDEGIYVCAACGTELFDSTNKFDAHCGWPSFDRPFQEGNIIYTHDTSLGTDRIEVTCAKCGGHLGHVFDDGPTETTGKRFCINSVSLSFKPKSEA